MDFGKVLSMRNSSPSQEPVLACCNVSVTYAMRGRDVAAVRDVDLHVMQGEAIGIVGESGSGKSTLALAVMRYLGRNGVVENGQILFKSKDMAALSSAALRRVRGAGIAMVYQDPAAALNPAMRLSAQLIEALMCHEDVSADTAWTRARDMLGALRVMDPERIMKAYPHQVSGGQQQRVVIAMALLTKPDVLLLDEPTTALDATVEAEIVALIKSLAAEFGTALVFISHNLALLRQTCDRLYVMQDGRVVESGLSEDLFKAAQHPYTQALLAAMVDVTAPVPAREVSGDVVLAGNRLSKSFKTNHAIVHAVRHVDVRVRAGETLAIVGESGSGKTTLARLLIGLELADTGTVSLRGNALSDLALHARSPEDVRALQMIFQNPAETLNPSRRVGMQLVRVLRKFGVARSDADARAQALKLIDAVQLPTSVAGALPHQLSGGQQQRVAIARAFAGNPAAIIADEPVSALDASVQLVVLEALAEMQRTVGTSVVLISHDLGMVRSVADRIVVMYMGQIVEEGATQAVFEPPYHPYTEALLSAIFGWESSDLPAQTPDHAQALGGCAFAARCRHRLGNICVTDAPPMAVLADGHRIRCHLNFAGSSTLAD